MDNTAMSDTHKSELIEFFQANYLDGDAIQQGQMVSSTVVEEFITDFVEPLITQQCNQARLDENVTTAVALTSIIPDTFTYNKFLEYAEYRKKTLETQAKESNKGE
jgi:hypothetical protein